MGKSPNDTIATQEMENLVDVQIVRKSADPIHHDQEAEEKGDELLEDQEEEEDDEALETEETLVTEAARRRRDYSEVQPLYRPKPYDLDEIEHLFMDGEVPEELRYIEDPIEFNYLLVKLKKEFNDKTRSEYLSKQVRINCLRVHEFAAAVPLSERRSGGCYL